VSNRTVLSRWGRSNGAERVGGRKELRRTALASLAAGGPRGARLGHVSSVSEQPITVIVLFSRRGPPRPDASIVVERMGQELGPAVHQSEMSRGPPGSIAVCKAARDRCRRLHHPDRHVARTRKRHLLHEPPPPAPPPAQKPKRPPPPQKKRKNPDRRSPDRPAADCAPASNPCWA